MVGSAKWISSVTVGLVLALEASPAAAQQSPTYRKLSPTASSREKSADYVVEVPADSAEDQDANEADDDGSSNGGQISQGTSDAPTSEVIKERFPNGSVKIQREVTQDAQGNYVNHGAWKMWDAQGHVMAQGEYQHGERNGTWIRWYKSVTEADLLQKAPYQQFVGPFISTATFKNGQLDGAWTIYDSKKHRISHWEFTNGKRNGTSTWWSPSGHKSREIQFRDGDMDGQFVEWSPEGKPTLNQTYQAGRKLARKESHHAGGAKKSEGTYLFAKEIEQTPDDWWNLKAMTLTKTGKDEKHGPWQSFHANGQKQIEGTYEHDLQVGKFNWWHANGQKALEGSFEQGKQDGDWTWWYPSGQKSIHGEYAHGNPTGRWTWWKEDGKVAQSADLSHSDGVVIDMPNPSVPNTTTPVPMPRIGKPVPRQPIKR